MNRCPLLPLARHFFSADVTKDPLRRAVSYPISDLEPFLGIGDAPRTRSDQMEEGYTITFYSQGKLRESLYEKKKRATC